MDKVVFDDQNVERRSWSCLGQTCSRSLFVFLSQFFVILLNICGFFWRIHLAKTCGESTVCVGILCSAAGFVLHSPNLWTCYSFQKTTFFHLWLDRAIPAKHICYMSGCKLEHFNRSLTKCIFSINTLIHSTMTCRKKLIILS